MGSTGSVNSTPDVFVIRDRNRFLESAFRSYGWQFGAWFSKYTYIYINLM